MTMLSDFFAPYDIDSLRRKVLASDGIDIQGVYCLASGKIMGTYDSSEIQFAIDEIGTDDEESLIDDLLVRVVASMRPSPALNKPDRFTIREMVASRPVDALAYLANRLHGSRDQHVKTALETHFEGLLGRILLHRNWSNLSRDGMDLNPWIHWLLELDAKTNLHDIDGPRVSISVKNGETWIRDPKGALLLTVVTVDNHVELLKLFESWVFERIDSYDQRDRELLKESQWVRGNTFAKSAFVRSWLENPQFATRKAEADSKLRAKAKAGRPAKSPRTQKLNAETNEFLHLLEGLLDGTLEMDTPAPTPSKPRVMLGGMLKLNLAKKGA